MDLVLAAMTRNKPASKRSRSAKDGERQVVSGHGEARPGLIRNPARRAAMDEDRMLQWFECEHLPYNLRGVARIFTELADALCSDGAEWVRLEPGPERTVTLRKLLEARDAAIRARQHPGN